MIYFDNAATTRTKPPEVAQAVVEAMTTFGGVGRGVHEASLDAGTTVFSARSKISDLFGGPGAKQVAFCSNATEALNTAIMGLLNFGDHAITTAASHNSVLRPLFRARFEGKISLTIIPIAPDGSVDYEAFDEAFWGNTRLAVVTHASNLTGDVYDIERMAHIAHSHDALLIVDAAQTAGVIPIDMAKQGVDIVCFTGHKSLYGPQGTGGLCVAEGLEIIPLKVGGSGTHSFDKKHPSFMPERLEAGTLNGHGIAGLLAGVEYVKDKGIDAIHDAAVALADRFVGGVSDIAGVKVYGGGGMDRTGVVAINIGDTDSAMVADMLSSEYGICTRAGAHCAPLMHEALGTEHQGAVRFSFSHFNTEEEVDEGIRAIAAIAKEIG